MASSLERLVARQGHRPCHYPPFLLHLFCLRFVFVLRLVADVLGQEDKSNGERSVPMDKVVMLIWQFRDDPTVVTFMAKFVSKVCSQVCG